MPIIMVAEVVPMLTTPVRAHDAHRDFVYTATASMTVPDSMTDAATLECPGEQPGKRELKNWLDVAVSSSSSSCRAST